MGALVCEIRAIYGWFLECNKCQGEPGRATLSDFTEMSEGRESRRFGKIRIKFWIVPAEERIGFTLFLQQERYSRLAAGSGCFELLQPLRKPRVAWIDAGRFAHVWKGIFMGAPDPGGARQSPNFLD